jgi:hypothetical protein
MHARTRTTRLLAGTVLLLAACTVGLAADVAGAASDKEPIQRIVYGQTTANNAPGQELYLQKVVIAPGAKLAEHFHEGTQLATVRAGVLTYNIVSGEAVVTRPGGEPKTVAGPSVVTLRTGDTLVESSSLVHYGSNRGKRPVVIELATLLRIGAPLSTPVGEGDAGAAAVHLETTLTSQSRTLHQVGADGGKTYGWNLLTGMASLDDQPVAVEFLGGVNYVGGSGPFTAFLTFTYADGSTLGASMQGNARFDSATGDTALVATLAVIGGTGKYAATTGTGAFAGTRHTALGGDITATFDLGLHG